MDFEIEYILRNKIDGGYKDTICRIFVKSRGKKWLLGEGIAYWNRNLDEYDLNEGKKWAFVRAYNALTEKQKHEFITWSRQYA